MEEIPMHGVLRKSIFILNITVLLLGGCASKQSQQNSNASTEPPSLIVVITEQTHWTNAHWPIRCVIKKIDSQKEINRFISKISPGKHFISIDITWSNFYGEEINLIIDTVSGKKYEIYALEVDKGLVGKVKVQPSSVVQPLTDLLLHPYYLGAYLYLPIFFGKAFHSLIVPPQKRPEGKVCFVWVEDTETHQLIAGIKPNNGDKNLDEE